MQEFKRTTNDDASHTIPSHNSHKLTRFYFIVASYAIGISVLAICSTMLISEQNLKKDDSQVESLTYLLFTVDWWNDYQAHKLREKIYNMEIDNLNISLHEDQTQQHLVSINQQAKDVYKQQILTKYQFLNRDLHNNSNPDSINSLMSKANNNSTLYKHSLQDITKHSALITQFDFVTILLIMAASIAGISEIAKNKLLGYSAFVLGGIGAIILLQALSASWH